MQPVKAPAGAVALFEPEEEKEAPGWRMAGQSVAPQLPARAEPNEEPSTPTNGSRCRPAARREAGTSAMPSTIANIVCGRGSFSAKASGLPRRRQRALTARG